MISMVSTVSANFWPWPKQSLNDRWGKRSFKERSVNTWRAHAQRSHPSLNDLSDLSMITKFSVFLKGKSCLICLLHDHILVNRYFQMVCLLFYILATSKVGYRLTVYTHDIKVLAHWETRPSAQWPDKSHYPDQSLPYPNNAKHLARKWQVSIL